MLSDVDINRCRICGYLLDEPPWGEDGRNPSFDICPCCGVEFGYEDCRLSGIRKFRQEWLAKGSPWFDSSKKPADWGLENQLKSIPQQYA